MAISNAASGAEAPRMRRYRNPFWPRSFADPFVLKVRGHYYAYATEDRERPAVGEPVFPILASPDLVRWRSIGHAMPALDHPYFRYWAPEVTEHNGRFLLYYAVHTGEFHAAIRVAVAEQPEGPFRDSGHDLTGALFDWAIDPHVFRDDDGTWYLFATVEFTGPDQPLEGTGNVVDRLLDPFHAEGRTARVVSPRHPWQLFERQRAEKGGVDWYCTEGPAVLRHRGRYYQFYSGGCYYRDNYAVSYAVADRPRGIGGMSDESWREGPAAEEGLFVRGRPGRLVSPGHNSVVLGPNNADLYIAYHAWPPDRSGRLPCLDRLFPHGDALWTPAPTDTPQPAPTSPRLLDRFEQPLEDRWQARRGQWQRQAGEVLQADRLALEASLAATEELGHTWLLEINLRYIQGDQYGVLLGGRDPDLYVLLDPGARHIVVGPAASPDGRTLARWALPDDFAPDAWHQLLLAGAGSLLTVQLDGLPLGIARCPQPLTGHFALYTRSCSAAFAAVALTDHFRDELLDGSASLRDLGWHASGDAPVSWHIQEGAVRQPDARNGEQVLLKGGMLGGYEYGATMHLLEESSQNAARPAFGLVIGHVDKGSVAVWLAPRAGGWAVEVEGRGAAAVDAAVDLPAAFDPAQPHTLRLLHLGGIVRIYLDGPPILECSTGLLIGRCGLLTRDAAAAFTGVWQTGLPRFENELSDHLH